MSRGRSQLAESFVCIVPLVKIDRLIALSLDLMDHGAWPFFFDGVTCLVNSVSVRKERHQEKMKIDRSETR